MNSTPESDDEEDEDDDDRNNNRPVLIVKASGIPNAGQGLFLASPRFVPAGTILLDEECPIAIRRPAAKKILNSSEWRGLQPVIQIAGDRFLDIRSCMLYKANHWEATSPKCNVYVSQTGPARLTMTTLRGIWRNEEILWEYSKTMQDFC